MDGILVLAKPQGPTSHDMVALVRRLTGTRRVGHGGTLDPFATGVLPIFLGKATRVVEFHLGAVKRYRATVCFGAMSTTDDLEGELTPGDGPAPTREVVDAALGRFRGEILQRPPAYSAIKVAGRRAYAMARAGETPELAARRVTIHELTMLDWDATDPVRPTATLEVTCSAGTYIRALARDLGEAVGSGAYLGSLARTASGEFTIDDAVAVETVRAAAAAGEGSLAKLLRPIDQGLEALPVVRLTAAEREAAIRGQFVRPTSGLPANSDPDVMIRLVDEAGVLVGLGRVRAGRIVPEKVLVDLEARAGSATGAAAEATGATEGDDLSAAAAESDAEGPQGQPQAGVPAHQRQRTGARPPSASVPAVPAPVTGSGTRVVAGLDALQADDGPLFVVVGVFDGLHRGHAYLLDRLRGEAAKRNARPAVITFDAHPEEILLGSAPPLLCDHDERLARLAAAGVEVTVVQHFDRALRMTPYQGFVAMITRRTALAGLLMTPDAAFGHERAGTPDALAELGREVGFEVVVVPPFQIAGREVRSADIRALIGVGDLVGAAALLGRPYAFVGRRSALEAGSLADPRRDILTFPMPVALPPAGTYAVTVQAAVRSEGSSAAPSSGAIAAAVEIPAQTGWVTILAHADIPDVSGLRVAFEPPARG